ncbi:MAG: serine protease [Hamadaea sp.]|nr:serine protease [Hamadaea sp.]
MRWMISVLAACSALLTAHTPVAAQAPADRPHEQRTRTEVVGGVRAARGDFPWLVHLSVSCSGALIRPRFVLTAAHCAGPSGRNTRIRVVGGTHDLRDPGAQVSSSVSVRRAGGFTGVTDGRDWAVIKLREAMDLPTLRLSGGGEDDRGVFTIMGWGSTDENTFSGQRHLRTAKVPLVPDTACASAYAEAGYDFDPAGMICAGDVRRGGVDTCQGDSGGPMVKRAADGAWVEVGIVSWGVGCARREFPGVYTQVSHFAEDIEAAVAELQ